MKNKLLIVGICILMFNSTIAFSQEDEKKVNFKWSGFVTAETFYDTRQTKTLREGDILLFPEPILKDANGEDINAKPHFNMASLHSRLRSEITGAEFRNAKISGVIEFDFAGSADPYVHLIRLRHAFVKSKWSKVELLAGQYWHPMFVPECFPSVISWGAGLPIHVLVRSPQIRFTWNPNNVFKASIAILSQRDFTNSGPNQKSSLYIRNSAIPETQLQFIAGNNNTFIIGATAGYKQLTPRIVSNKKLRVDEKISGINANLFAKLKTGALTIKLQQIYGENCDNLVMLGGYAVKSIDTITDERTYTNIAFTSTWADINYSGKLFDFGIFAGFTKNLGSREKVEEITEIYGLGTNIDMMYNISPRVEFKMDKLKYCFEITYLSTFFGTNNNNLKVTDTKDVNNIRFLLNIMYSF